MTASEWIDFVCIAFDVETREPAEIIVLDTQGSVAVELTPALARELARKLTDLADEFEQHRPLRRLAAVEDQLRGLND